MGTAIGQAHFTMFEISPHRLAFRTFALVVLVCFALPASAGVLSATDIKQSKQALKAVDLKKAKTANAHLAKVSNLLLRKVLR